MTKDAMIALRAKCAADLDIKEPKDQKVHVLMVSRTYKRLLEEYDGDWKKAHSAVMAIGHGFACNASQCNQWMDKAEGGVKAEVLADLDI